MKKILFSRICILIVVILFLTVSIATNVVENNVFHTQHCEIHNCSLCAFVKFANYYNNILSFITLKLFGIELLLLCINNCTLTRNTIEKYTLVKLKVIQNE